MLYTEKDIDFSIVTPTEFENLCFDIVRLSGFLNVTWRQGGADNGRDIDAKLPFTSIFTPDHYTNWHFECKHYSGGVPPEELTAKVAWADAEGVDFLLFFP